MGRRSAKTDCSGSRLTDVQSTPGRRRRSTPSSPNRTPAVISSYEGDESRSLASSRSNCAGANQSCAHSGAATGSPPSVTSAGVDRGSAGMYSPYAVIVRFSGRDRLPHLDDLVGSDPQSRRGRSALDDDPAGPRVGRLDGLPGAAASTRAATHVGRHVVDLARLAAGLGADSKPKSDVNPKNVNVARPVAYQGSRPLQARVQVDAEQLLRSPAETATPAVTSATIVNGVRTSSTLTPNQPSRRVGREQHLDAGLSLERCRRTGTCST